MSQQKTFTLIEITKITGLGQDIILAYIQKEWIQPTDQTQIDEEDLARIRLIKDLQHDFGANDESVPLILHLLDQLYYLRNKVRDQSLPSSK